MSGLTRRRCAVLGDPIEHSLSPTLHRAAYAELGLDWTYDAIRVPAGGLERFLVDAGNDWRGLSLTMPLKREVLALATTTSERARLVGAANTLIVEDGALHADNTDLPGATEAVRERWAGPVRAATVLGAGATAASTGLAMCELGATSITVLARTPARAVPTLAAIARHPSGPQVRIGSLAEDPVEGDVVVSTIPAHAQDPGLVARCRAVPVVFEVVYDPWPTPLAASVGSSADRVLVTGLDLLVHQAGLQLTAFTGLPAPLVTMREAGRAALVDRAASAESISRVER